jgi:hypothetical protein
VLGHNKKTHLGTLNIQKFDMTLKIALKNKTNQRYGNFQAFEYYKKYINFLDQKSYFKKLSNSRML